MEDEIAKRYYTIGEVAEMLEVNASLLRYWETEFKIVQPKKNRKGERQYTDQDIEKIRMIYGLVKEKGFTLQGAKDYIKAKNREDNQKAALADSLEKIKLFLTGLKNTLEKSEKPAE